MQQRAVTQRCDQQHTEPHRAETQTSTWLTRPFYLLFLASRTLKGVTGQTGTAWREMQPIDNVNSAVAASSECGEMGEISPTPHGRRGAPGSGNRKPPRSEG